MIIRPAVKLLGMASLLTSYLPLTSALSLTRTPSQTLDVLLTRDLTCVTSNLTSCSSVDPKLPGNFCCVQNHHCISLDSSSSALCCPSGATCDQIRPISCDVSEENPVSNPGTLILTTKLHQNLPVCGDLCCPFGYVCGAQDNQGTTTHFCELQNQTSVTSAASISSSSTTNTTKSSGIDSNQTQTTTQCPRFPGAAVAVGFVPGLLAGAILTILAIAFFFRSPDSRPTSRSSSLYKPAYPSRDAYGNVKGVSGPIPLDSQNARTEFLNRTTSRAKSIFHTMNEGHRAPYETKYEVNWKMPTPPVQNNIPMQPVSKVIPITPQRYREEKFNMAREPSTESIRVYSPSGMSRSEAPIHLVRGMEAQRQQGKQSAIGSPFKTPPSNKYTYPEEDAPDQAETLSPARYNDGKQREGGISRPMTSFTEMLHSIDFPDPGRAPAPAVPQVPKGMNWGGKRTKEI